MTSSNPSGPAPVPLSYGVAPSTPINWTDWLRKLGPLVGLIFVFSLFSILRPHYFPTIDNIELMARHTAVVATAALGMTMIIISGGIDLSVGSIIAVVTMVVAYQLTRHVSPLAAALTGVLCGCICGAINGIIRAGVGLIPFITTLITWGAFRGVAKQIGNDRSIYPPASWLNQILQSPEKLKWMVLPPGVWIALILSLLVAGLLRYTRFGRHVFAIGSNRQTARLCGVNVRRTTFLVYMVGGGLAGVAGVMQFGFLTMGDPTTATGMELSIIAAVVIGGASLSGGQGSITGTIIGALIMTIVGNGCTKLDLSQSYQQIITGCVIFGAATLDRLQHGKDE